jgi:hypothetical protein
MGVDSREFIAFDYSALIIFVQYTSIVAPCRLASATTISLYYLERDPNFPHTFIVIAEKTFVQLVKTRRLSPLRNSYPTSD